MAGSADRRLVNLLAALSLALTDRVTEAVEEVSELRDAGPAALVAIHESAPGKSIDDLRQLVGLTHSGAVRLVDRLVHAGYVERGRGRSGRSVALKLTRRGAAVARKIRAARHDEVARSLDALDAADQAILARVCELLLTTMTEPRMLGRDNGEQPGGALCRLCDFASCGRPGGRCPAARAATEHRARIEGT
ncbi:MAG: MarR family winged helix-turn-helix transcriptional regulator [Mycobacteriales bacterium]